MIYNSRNELDSILRENSLLNSPPHSTSVLTVHMTEVRYEDFCSKQAVMKHNLEYHVDSQSEMIYLLSLADADLTS